MLSHINHQQYGNDTQLSRMPHADLFSCRFNSGQRATPRKGLPGGSWKMFLQAFTLRVFPHIFCAFPQCSTISFALQTNACSTGRLKQPHPHRRNLGTRRHCSTGHPRLCNCQNFSPPRSCRTVLIYRCRSRRRRTTCRRSPGQGLLEPQ